MRRLVASVLFLVTLALAVGIATTPSFEMGRNVVFGLQAIFPAVILVGLAGWKRPSRVLLVAVFAAVLAVPAVTIARGFGRVDMMSVMFHLNTGTSGIGFEAVKLEFLQAVLSLSLIMLCFIGLSSLWNLGRRAAWVFTFALFAANPATQYFAMTLTRPPLVSSLITEIRPPKTAVGIKDIGDIVMIYLEGTDRQFADPAVWGNIYDPLSKLAAQGLSLTGVRQVEGTGWTLAGMMASQCGVPVLPNGLKYKTYDLSDDPFLPNIVCLGDLVKPLGYASAMIVGADRSFSGMGKLYLHHGFTTIIDKAVIATQLPVAIEKAAAIDWGYDDTAVLMIARQSFTTLVTGDVPFLLALTTISPHGKVGYISHSCTDNGRASANTDMKGQINCMLGDVTSFVAGIQAEHRAKRPGRALHIILQSDHLNHNPQTPAVSAAFDDANTVIYLSPNVAPGTIIAREASMIDVFATTLQVTGLSTPPVAANLGRSLLSEPETQFERLGKDTLNDFFTRDGELANRVWN